jgi:hypothetical protein
MVVINSDSSYLFDVVLNPNLIIIAVANQYLLGVYLQFIYKAQYTPTSSYDILIHFYSLLSASSLP